MMTLPTSEYFTLQQLADGIFAAIGKVNSPAFSNAGIIDTGDHTLIFDTFNTYRAAEDLKDAAELLTGRRTDFVVISHSHADHWMGNQVFADHANIIATPKIYDEIVEGIEYFREIKRDPDEYEAYIDETEKNQKSTEDERLREHLSWNIIIERHQFSNLRTNKPTLPNQTFTGRMTIHGTDRRADLHTPGAGHTASDVILSLPQDSIAFIGDLGFFQTHPYLGSSNPEKWVATLEVLAESDIETFVPGHGPIGTKNDLLALKEYIQTCKKMAADVIKSEGSQDSPLPPVPDFSKNWAGYGRFERSMRFLYQLEKK